MNTHIHTFRSAQQDPLVINDATRHQYYSTMQAEVCDEDMLDVAFNRRQARVLIERRDRQRLAVWLVVLTACALAGLAWALS